MKKIKVNRRLFMAWVDGILLDRDSNGVCLVTDSVRLETQFNAAQKAMDDGKTIYLTNDSGKIITRMSLQGEGDSEGYVEEECETK